MAWAIEFDGATSRAYTNNAWIPSDIDNWSVKLRIKKTGSAGYGILFVASNTSNIYIKEGGAGKIEVRVGNVLVAATGTNFTPASGEFVDLEVNCVSGTFEVLVDAVSYGSATRGNLLFDRANVFFASYGGSSLESFQLEYADLADPVTSSNSRYYSATASNHDNTGVQPSIVDTIGGNNTIGTGFSTADLDYWVNLGGGALTILPVGIASEEVFGTHTVDVGVPIVITPVGVASEEVFGTTTISLGSQSLMPSSIASEEAVGVHTITFGTRYITPIGVSTGEVFGNTLFTGGEVVTLSSNAIVQGMVEMLISPLIEDIVEVSNDDNVSNEWYV